MVDFGLAPLMLTSPSEADDSGGKRKDPDDPPTPSEAATPGQRGTFASPGLRSGAASPGEVDPGLSSRKLVAFVEQRERFKQGYTCVLSAQCGMHMDDPQKAVRVTQTGSGLIWAVPILLAVLTS